MTLFNFTGKDLIDLGFREGLGLEAIDFVNENELKGEALMNYLQQFKLPKPIPVYENPIDFVQNIKAENELEEKDRIDVIETMQF